jgi:hypothetical protein
VPAEVTIPGVKLIDGAEVYPTPGLVMVMPVTAPEVSTASAVAFVVAPPPLMVTTGRVP